jgi:NitT/TauT family transport system substrate-binding protein
MKKQAAAIAVMAVIALAGFGAWCFLKPPAIYSGKPESITIGVPPNEQSGLIFIAEDQGYFAQNGLNAAIKTYDTALAALDGMKKGEVDISQSAELPIVRQALEGESISVLAGIDRFQNVHLVGRKDRGIENQSDLKGKKIGTARGTLTEFYLGRFLNLHGISLHDVTIVNMPFSQSAEALASGAVDAFQVQNKDIQAIKERCGDLIIWPSQSGQPGYELIAGRRDWVAVHPEPIARLLKSLDQAEKYNASHPDGAMAIVQKRLNYDEAYMKTMRHQHRYSLSLDQSLILAMEDEARWVIDNDPTTGKQVPDFLDYIHAGGLAAVKPGAVNIIRGGEKP